MRTDALRFAFLAATLLIGGCLEQRDSANTPTQNECTRCHGSAERTNQTPLDQAAPPVDLAGNTDSSFPGVGAHQIHLNPSSTHLAFACKTCHIVPTDVTSPGHADTKLPAEVTLSDLAVLDGHVGNYDHGTRRCTDTYCHRSANPEWTKPRSSADACGTCHGLPPQTTRSGKAHPQSPDCYKCHSETVDAKRNIIDPSKHVDGKVEVAAFTCHTCHGSADSNAPPVDLSGNTDSSSPGVGAHQAHLTGGTTKLFRPVDCTACHVVPASVEAPGHIDNTPGAELTFSGIATAGSATPTYDRTTHTCKGAYCHGPEDPSKSVSPVWTTSGVGCTTCHGFPPAPPHPQMTQCSFCHTQTVNDDLTMKDRTKHVDGVVEVIMPFACNACHGSATSNAPPRDVEGNTATTSPGVGAHQNHLSPTFARPVLCSECHIVPKGIFDPGHFDTDRPAELTFSGVAVTGGAAPSFDSVKFKCSNTYCHGAAFPGGNASGGSLTEPQWTKVDETQDACGTCHGLPPPAPHPTLTASQHCSDCHSDINPDNTFSKPELHVDGAIE